MATDWQNFQDWLNTGQGWIFYFALFLAFLVILLYVAWRSVRAPGPQNHSETSLDQEQGESEQK
jgi:hypothetical protein